MSTQLPTPVPKHCLAAYALFLSRIPISEIAKQLNIPTTTLQDWRSHQKWVERRKHVEQQAMAQMENDHREDMIKIRYETVKRHVIIARELESAIFDKIKRKNKNTKKREPQSVKELLDIARAMKSATDISARAVGLDAINNAAVKDPSVGKAPLVVMNVQAESLPKPVIPVETACDEPVKHSETVSPSQQQADPF